MNFQDNNDSVDVDNALREPVEVILDHQEDEEEDNFNLPAAPQGSYATRLIRHKANWG